MNMYDLNESQSQVVAEASRIADEVIAQHAMEVDELGRFPSESMAALAEAGFWGLIIPEEYGGRGQSMRVMAAVVEELARRCASTAMVYMMHSAGVSCYLADRSKFESVLRESAAGRHLSTLAFSEKGSRSQFWAPLSQAVLADDGNVRLSAEKSWVTSAGYADGLICNAGAVCGSGVSVFLVRKDDPGLSISGGWNSLGMRGNQSNPMQLDQVLLNLDERLIGQDGRGEEIMLGHALPSFMLCQGAIGIGLAEAAVQSSVQHAMASRFENTGTQLRDLPNIRANLAKMRLEVDRARAYLVATLGKLESGAEDAMRHVLAVKASSGEVAASVSDLAMRTCGGAAFSKHLGIERTFRDSRAAIVMAPTSDHLWEFVGRLMTGLPLFEAAPA